MKPIISRLRHTVVALLFALSISAANAQISYTATFDQHLLTTDTVSENGDSYLRLRYPDLWTQSAAGTPELPVHYLRFSVPCDATDFTVSVTGETTTATRYTLPVYPPSRLFPPTGIQASNCSFPPTARYIATTDIGRLFRYKW